MESIKTIMTDLNIEPYRCTQIFQWLWQKNTQDFSAMTNISKALRKKISDLFTIRGIETETQVSARDGTEKFLFKLEDSKYIEAVFIPEDRRQTVCVSTQVGCPLGCKFCATALLGFKRNLRAYEIADQIRSIQKATGKKITNIVFMGMGEPLLNIKEVSAALDIISSPIGLGIGQRHTTISTVGLLDGMEYFLKSSLKVKMAISLNFPDEAMRKQMMPITRKNPLSQILKIAKEYSLKKSMVTFEYILIDDLNDHIKDAQRLLKLLRGIPSKINLIPFNPYPQLPYERPSVKKIERFYQYLLTSRHTITLRKSRGQEIFAACGQLAGQKKISDI